MLKLYIYQIKPYIAVLLATMALSTVFILTAYYNTESEQTYEMTDHQITNVSTKDEQYQVNSDEKSERTLNQFLAKAK